MFTTAHALWSGARKSLHITVSPVILLLNVGLSLQAYRIHVYICARVRKSYAQVCRSCDKGAVPFVYAAALCCQP